MCACVFITSSVNCLKKIPNYGLISHLIFNDGQMLCVTRWYLLRNTHQGRSTSGEGTREHCVKHSKAYLEDFVFNGSGLCGCSLSTRHRRPVYHLSSVQVTPVRTHPRYPPFP